jgi:hypothetical protein
MVFPRTSHTCFALSNSPAKKVSNDRYARGGKNDDDGRVFLPFGGAIDPKKTEKCSDNQILDNQTYLNLKTVLKKPSGV